MTTPKSVVIVGAGHAGFQLAVSLRQAGYDGRISLVNDEHHLPYQRPPLSKAYLKGGGGSDVVMFRPAHFFGDQRIDLVEEHAIGIDRSARRVAFRSGRVLDYDHLVLATGARNRSLAMPNANAEGVRYLRSLDESEVIRTQLGAAKRVVVVGAGFVGLEFASTARTKGLEIDVLELAPRIMARVVTAPVSDYFHARHTAAGSRIHLRAQAVAIEVTGGGVSGVRLGDCRRLDADLVVVGIGVIPNAELAANSGLLCSEGIVVNEYLATSDSNISAIGDCALFSGPRYPTPVRLESVQNATDQARCLAARLTGQLHSFDKVPWFWSDQGSDKLQIVGYVDQYDDMVIRGDIAQGSFSVFCYRAGRLIGIESVNRAADHMIGRRILAANGSIEPNIAADLKVDLKMIAA
jgi:3-phenylpropionate/trans-cinnamate dioxygenase ferredoxin reductase subunit